MSIEKITEISGTALPLRGDSIDTDRIIPARFLQSVSFAGLEEHLFEDDRIQADAEAAVTHPVSNPAYAGSAVLLVNANFGCGSSREHAPQAIRRWGIRAVVGESFSEIFFGNSVALGLPCLTASHADIDRLQAAVERDPSTVLTVDLDAESDLRRRGHGQGHAAARRAGVVPRRHVGRHRAAARSLRGGRGGRRPAAVRDGVEVRGRRVFGVRLQATGYRPDAALCRAAPRRRTGRHDVQRSTWNLETRTEF